ncbi:hypothetical protein F4777DRAFT_580588 [Nemania sp. FL0916]|nr:hypothetical protein F4777DRAFT_580588 [Nemania sp. FL0916]
MHISSILMLAVALTTSATPLNPAENELESWQPASGCYNFAAPHCCVPNVCQCDDGTIYLVNQDNVNKGLDGCDPPWEYLAASNTEFPGYCC